MVEIICLRCYGCGHICLRCKYGISGCYCDEDWGLDTEEIAPCPECKGTGVVVEPEAASA